MCFPLCCSKRETRPVDKLEQESFFPALPCSHRACIFCDVSKENGFNIVWENENYTVFTDINPSSQHHLQIIPKTHIESVKSLDVSNVCMVREMLEIGHNILDSLDVPPHLQRLGFHIPPYISVTHLHMHAQALPYRSLMRRLKYPVVYGRNDQDKGFSWFIEAEQAIRVLEKGSQIRLLPC
ncbi:HIT-like protein [Trametes gibbosa]|nr:HIT-like protein [Trametes gibbosa]